MITGFTYLVEGKSDQGLVILLLSPSLSFVFYSDSLSHFFFSLLLYPPHSFGNRCCYWFRDDCVGKAVCGGLAA